MFLSTENLGKREEIVKIPKLHDVHPGLKKIKIMSYTRKQLSFLTVTISQWSKTAYIWISWGFPPEIQMSNMWALFDKSTEKVIEDVHAALQNPANIHHQDSPEPAKGQSYVSGWLCILTHHKIFTSNIAPKGYNLRQIDSHHLLLPFCLSLKSQSVLVQKLKGKFIICWINLNVPFTGVHFGHL